MKIDNNTNLIDDDLWEEVSVGATVLELERDLKDHSIEKAALFEFGNLHGEIDNF